MRINVYSEELTDRVENVQIFAEGGQFDGIRFYLKTHEDLIPPKHGDDDSNAVTFWGRGRRDLIALFKQAVETLERR